jgi:hypothetical protein
MSRADEVLGLFIRLVIAENTPAAAKVSIAAVVHTLATLGCHV